MSRFVFVIAASVFGIGLVVGAQAQVANQPIDQQDAERDSRVVKIFSLKHADAEDMQRIVTDLFRDLNSRQQFFGRSGSQPVSMRTSFDPRTNSLIVFGPEDDLGIIEALVMRLDTPTPPGREQDSKGSNVPGIRDLEPSKQQDGRDRERALRDRPPRSERDRSDRNTATTSDTEVTGTQLRIEAQAPQGGSLKILSIAPVGKRVKQGDLLVELDTSAIENAIREQKIVAQRAQAEVQQSETVLQNILLQRESKVAEARQELDLARLNLVEYQEGTRPLQIEIHENEVKQAELQLERQKGLAESGRGDSALLPKLMGDLEIAQARLNVYRKFTAPKAEKELENTIAAAERQLQRVRNSTEAESKAAEAQLAAQRAHLDLAVAELNRLEVQLQKGKIVAPHDGVVAAAAPVPLRENSLVREGQVVLIVIPDE